MDYRITITQGTQVLGKKVISPSEGEEGWLGCAIDEIMTPVRKAGGGPVGEYLIKITEVAPGILDA